MCSAPIPLKFFKWFLGCLAVFLSVTIFAAVSRAQPQYGGTLKLGIEYRSYGFDPIKARMYTATSVTAAHMVMEGAPVSGAGFEKALEDSSDPRSLTLGGMASAAFLALLFTFIYRWGVRGLI